MTKLSAEPPINHNSKNQKGFLMSGKGFVHLSLHYFMWLILHLKSWSVPTIAFFNSRIQSTGKDSPIIDILFTIRLCTGARRSLLHKVFFSFLWTKILWLKMSHADKLQEHKILNFLLNRRGKKRRKIIKKKKTPKPKPNQTPKNPNNFVQEGHRKLSCASLKINFLHWITSSSWK